MKHAHPQNHPLDARGFSLIELLVVIAILGILMGLLFPALNQSRQRAKSIKCLGHLRQLAIAIESYKMDYDGRMYPGEVGDDPDTPCVGWAGKYYSYVKSTGVFACPTDQAGMVEIDGKKLHTLTYFFNLNLGYLQAPAGFHENGFQSAGHTIILAENTGGIPHEKVELENPNEKDSIFANKFYRDDSSPYNRHMNGRNFLMGDSHVVWLSPKKVCMGKLDEVHSPQQLPAGIEATTAAQ